MGRTSKLKIYIHKQHQSHNELTNVFYREESYYSNKPKWWTAIVSKIFLKTMIEVSEINYTMQYFIYSIDTDAYVLERMIKGNKMAISYVSYLFEVSYGNMEFNVKNKMVNIPSGIFLAQIL